MASLGESLVELFSPLSMAFEDVAYLQMLLAEVGFTGELLEEHLPAVEAILPIAEKLAELEDLVASDAEPGTVVEAIVGALEALSSVDTAQITSLPAELSDPAFWGQLALRLPGFLLVRWLDDFYPVLSALLILGGAIVEEQDEGEDEPRRELDWPALGALISDPPAQVKTRWGFGGDHFDHEGLLEALADLALALGFAPLRMPASTTMLDALGAAAPASATSVGVELLRAGSGDVLASASLHLVGAASGDPEVVTGLALLPRVLGALATERELGSGLALTLSASGEASGGAGAALRPGGMDPIGAASAVELTVGLSGEPPEGWVLLGEREGTHLRLDRFAAKLGISLGPGPELRVVADASDALFLVIQPTDGDSFLADVLGGDPIEVGGGIALAYSTSDGFALAGGLGFEVTIPINKRIGPLEVECIALAAFAGTGGLEVEVSASGSVVIGPITATLDQLGLRVEARPREDGFGDVGPLQIEIAPALPTGAGLAIDAGPVSGGGYLSVDREAGRYSGVADLDILGVGLSAIGVLATELPNGDDDWSLFLSLAARLPGLQLGFGFTLEGVGGLLGVHRGLDPEALGDAVRSGALDAILFPEDPIGDALSILAAIESVFPSSRGQYVVGPIARIGWGTPTLIAVDLGVAIQLPDPVTVSLVGALSSVLPDEELAILELHVAFAGTVDLTAGSLRIDASLGGSRVAGLQLTGDMAVRAGFLGDPAFLVAFGGFHPDFDPPGDFPRLERLGVALSTGDDLHVSLGGYFALTSNTIQFGARAELWAKAAGFTAEGGTSFDALITFTPFGFKIGLSVWFSISAGNAELLGVLLEGRFTGPKPWHVNGKATFKLLGVKKSLEIEATVGKAGSAAPPERVNVQQLLEQALERDDAWSVTEPSGPSTVVCEDDAGSVHPAGRIVVRQRIVPLDTRIDHYGNAEVEGTTTFEVRAAGFSAGEVEDVQDHFASAQYLAMAADEKLSAPSFVKMTSGLSLGSGATAAGEARPFTCDHELVYRDPAGGHTDDEERAAGLTRASILSRTLAARAGAPAAFSVTIDSVAYVAASSLTGRALDDATAADFVHARESALTRDQAVIRPAYELERTS